MVEINNFKRKFTITNSTIAIIVNYNDAQRTINLVKDIIDYQALKNVIVVNNNSTDNSIEILSDFEHPKYLIINSEINGGYGYGNNLGIKRANEIGADFVLICNPDIVFQENTLNSMIKKIGSDTKCSIINARETHLGNFAWKYTNTFQDIISASIIMNKLFKSRYYDEVYFKNKSSAIVDVIQGSFLLISLPLMIKYGMYDEDFFLYEEEKVLYKKFIDHGYYALTDLDVNYEHHHVDSKKITINQLVTSKRRLLQSKLLYLMKYRHLNKQKLNVAKLFFDLTIIEMYIYSSFLIVIQSLKRINNE